MEGRSAETARQPRQSLSKKSLPFWLAIGAAGILLIVVAGFFIHRSLRLSTAKRDVALLVLGLDGYAREQNEYPSGTTGEICAMLRGETVRGQNARQLDYLEAGPSEINDAGEFLDPWGMPYRIAIKTEPRVYSCGPNRVDEQGEGDDIASWR